MCVQGKIVVGTQNSAILEIEEKNGQVQVSNLFTNNNSIKSTDFSPPPLDLIGVR